MSEPAPAEQERGAPTLDWGIIPAILLCSAAVLLFALEDDWGYVPLAASVILGFGHSRLLGRDLGLIAIALGIISTISLKADISWGNIAVMGIVLSLAVIVPSVINRTVFKDRTIVFPVRRGQPWSRAEWSWLAIVLFLAWLILPFYFITSGVYTNWPAVITPSEITRLFIGVNAVGIWDELFFICTVFALLARHFPFWVANALQATIFVSFLWELGYQSWGPLLTIPFALVQAWIFTKTKSLTYVVCVHLLFDLFVFLTIVHAHHGTIPIFLVG